MALGKPTPKAEPRRAAHALGARKQVRQHELDGRLCFRDHRFERRVDVVVVVGQHSLARRRNATPSEEARVRVEQAQEHRELRRRETLARRTRQRGDLLDVRAAGHNAAGQRRVVGGDELARKQRRALKEAVEMRRPSLGNAHAGLEQRRQRQRTATEQVVTRSGRRDAGRRAPRRAALFGVETRLERVKERTIERRRLRAALRQLQTETTLTTRGRDNDDDDEARTRSRSNARTSP